MWVNAVDWPVFIVGAILLLGGWLLYWIGVQAAAGGTLAAAGLLAAEAIAQRTELSELHHWLLRGGLMLSGFLVGVLVMRLLHSVGFFLLGAAIGGAAWGYGVLALRTWEMAPAWIQTDAAFAFGIPFAAVIVGLLFVSLAPLMIRAATSIMGAGLVASALPVASPLLVAAPLAVAGFAIQSWMVRERTTLPEEDVEK